MTCGEGGRPTSRKGWDKGLRRRSCAPSHAPSLPVTDILHQCDAPSLTKVHTIQVSSVLTSCLLLLQDLSWTPHDIYSPHLLRLLLAGMVSQTFLV